MIARRYPGALPFNSKQQNIFYGRDKDIEKLLTLIQVEKQVLLYSKSGLGKTSLLEAGVIPRLPENYIALSVRFYAFTKDGLTPVERIIEALRKNVSGFDNSSKNVLDGIVKDKTAYKTLWYYFKKLQILNNTGENEFKKKVYVLVFDQFEELFTYPEDQIEEFKEQFYELTRLNIPDKFAQLIAQKRRQDKESLSRDKISVLHRKNDVKTVFAIRSDRLSLLNSLSDKITDIQINYYEIKPLDDLQARNAIIKPASDPGKEFKTKPFDFHEEAVDKIINELTEGGSHNLETTQLQIVCQRIEEIAGQKDRGLTTEETVVINVEDLPEFKNIFLNFYNDTINKVPDDQQDAAKRLIEDELIRNQQRLSLDENICKDYVDEKVLEILVGRHLLRAEQNTFQRFSYELSHDTLVEPILESQKKYQEKQAALKAEKERQEELRKFKEKQEREQAEKQRKIKRQKILIQIGVVATVIVIGLGIAAFVLYLDAKAQRDFAEKQTNVAEKALTSLKQAQFNINMNDGIDLMERADYLKAAEKFKIANSIIDSLPAKILRDSCTILNKSKEKYEDYKHEGDSLNRQREFILSMQAYNNALKTGYNDNEVNRIRRALQVEALKIYRNDLEDYTEWKNQQMIVLTNKRIRKMQRLYKEFQ